MNRRDAVKPAAGAALVTLTAPPALVGGVPAAAQTPAAGPFTLPPLGYAFDALEPHIDAQTCAFSVAFGGADLKTVQSGIW